MRQIRKEYPRPFLLEPTKLTRIVDRIHERLTQHQNSALRDYFEVFLSGNQHEEMESLTEVFAMENSKHRRIQRLVMTCAAETEGAARPLHEVQIDFASHQPPATPGQSASGARITV